ncbi:hypothetical protein [Thalassobius sp. Cn5-15]|uniref:hypothetical protein n=1 Tax=Thalassobius sp. Cn5-15 TaxID=2917763 RepID=UPI001EF2228B|nr:hypothetical protein [Thalassobius sp. Cn5-15]MCG7494696.1 hypothetical protein [Thalassobius sp. Cn5-15]
MDTVALRERAKGLKKWDRVARIEEIRLMAMAALHGVNGVIRQFDVWHNCADLTAADVLPLHTCDISGRPAPAEPEKMLAVNYDASWRESDPYLKFPWAGAARRFKTFLGAVT